MGFGGRSQQGVVGMGWFSVFLAMLLLSLEDLCNRRFFSFPMQISQNIKVPILQLSANVPGRDLTDSSFIVSCLHIALGY